MFVFGSEPASSSFGPPGEKVSSTADIHGSHMTLLSLPIYYKMINPLIIKFDFEQFLTSPCKYGHSELMSLVFNDV